MAEPRGIIVAEGPREQTRLHEDLESIADSEHEASPCHQSPETADRRLLAGEHPGTPIVTEREATGEARQGDIGGHRLAGGMGKGVEPGDAESLDQVAVPVRAGEDDDGRPGIAHTTSSTDTE
ncbi:MAG TPA: hypothetical protein DCY40_03755 [Actinobacteria bacterium]|nr:hypothetical protein [Actinomycetota bacterium]